MIDTKHKQYKLKCPICSCEDDICNFPDLWWDDKNNTKAQNQQVYLLKELQAKGYNLVSCGFCGCVFIHRTERNILND